MKTVVAILDSLRFDAAQVHEGLNSLNWETFIPAGACAPYTPSSLTTLTTGLYPATHRYWTFPVSYDNKPSPTSSVFSWPIPVRWSSSNVSACYAWPISSFEEDPIDFLDSHDDCILFVHLWESHCPYIRDLDIEDCLSELKALDSIDKRIEYVNEGVSAALDNLFGVLGEVESDFSLILTSDHGEALGEPHPSQPTLNRFMHQRSCKEEMLVPFLVSDDDMEKDFFHHVELVRYLANKYGIDVCDDTDFETDFTWNVCRWAYGDYHWFEQGLIGMVDGEIIWANKSFEANNFYESSSTDKMDFDAEFSKFWLEYGDPFDEIPERSISDKDSMRERLEALGYV